MKVLHLPSSYIPDTVGGTETFVSTLCSSLAFVGVECCVAVHTTVKGLPDDPEELVRLDSILCNSRLSLYSRSLKLSPPGFTELLERWQPDLVHFHALSLGASVDHIQVLQHARCPYLITYHTATQSCPRGTLLYHGQSACDGLLESSKCAACVLQSKGWAPLSAMLASKSPLSANFFDGPFVSRIALPSLLDAARHSTLLYFNGASAIVACADFCRNVLAANGVDAGKISVIRQALPGPTRHRKLRVPRDKTSLELGFFGRVTHLKGVDLAVDSLAHLRDAGVSCQLQIVGPVNPSEKNWLSGLLNKDPQVSYLGTLTGQRLSDWLRSIDLIIIPSRGLETGPLTLLEAWDQGTLAVGTDQAGIRDFMLENHLPQCLFAPENPASIACAIIRAQNLDEVTVCVPGSDEQVEQYKNLYESIVAKNEL